MFIKGIFFFFFFLDVLQEVERNAFRFYEDLPCKMSMIVKKKAGYSWPFFPLFFILSCLFDILGHWGNLGSEEEGRGYGFGRGVRPQ